MFVGSQSSTSPQHSVMGLAFHFGPDKMTVLVSSLYRDQQDHRARICGAELIRSLFRIRDYVRIICRDMASMLTGFAECSSENRAISTWDAVSLKNLRCRSWDFLGEQRRLEHR